MARNSRPTISFFYKLLSSKYYLTEIPVENKRTVLFHSIFGRNVANDTMKIIRTGSCITLLSDYVPIEARTFFRMLYFEEYAKYAFWTFNGNFIMELSDYLIHIDNDNIELCIEVLKRYPTAYDQKLNTGLDQEVSYCFRKVASLKKDKEFDLMFFLDLQNRKAVFDMLVKRLVASEKENQIAGGLITSVPGPQNNGATEISFLEMLVPINGSLEKTLNYLESKIIEARFPHNIFHTIPKTRRGANQTGLNSEIAAMVKVFQDKGYFKKEFTFKDLYKSFGTYTKNKSGKDYDYSFFVDEYNFKKYMQYLELLEITHLNLKVQEF